MALLDVLADVVHEARDVMVVERVIRHAAQAPDANEARRPEEAQLVGHRRLGQADKRGQIAHAPLAVRQRTREIGVRIAVGAEPIQVARMFLKSGVLLGVIGLAIGLPLSVIVLKLVLATENVMAAHVNPFLIGGVISVLLLSVAAVATWLPARRATLVDPASALRSE